MKQFIYFQCILSLLTLFQSTFAAEHDCLPSIRISLCKRDRWIQGTLQMHQAFGLPRFERWHSRNSFSRLSKPSKSNQSSNADSPLTPLAVIGHKIPLKKFN